MRCARSSHNARQIPADTRTKGGSGFQAGFGGEPEDLTPICPRNSAMETLALCCCWTCPRHQSRCDEWFVCCLISAIMVLPEPRHVGSGGHDITRTQDGSGERLRGPGWTLVA